MPGDHPVEKLPHGEVLASRQIHDDVARPLRTRVRDGAVEQPLRQRLVPREFGWVDRHLARQVRQPAVTRECVELVVASPRLLLGAAEHERQTGHDADGIPWPSVSRCARTQLLGVAQRIGQRGLRRKHTVGVAGGQVEPAGRAAGLEEDRVSLRRAGQRERASDLEELTRVVDRADGTQPAERTAALVSEHGVVVPRIPQRPYDVHELRGTPVAIASIGLTATAEVVPRVWVAARHDVPRHPATAEMIQRREASGHVVGVLEGRRHRADQTQMRGRRGECRQQHQRVERQRRGRQRLVRRLEQRGTVGEEQRVESAAFCDVRQPNPIRRIGEPVRVDLGVLPRRRVHAVRQHVDAEVQLPLGTTHRGSPGSASFFTSRSSAMNVCTRGSSNALIRFLMFSVST